MDPTEIVGDCSQIQQPAVTFATSGGPIQLGFTSTLDDDVGPNGYLLVELVYAGRGWVAWGFSQGSMAPGYSVIGIPGTTPETYYMAEKNFASIQPVDSSMQTLRHANLTQNATHTTLTFSKRLQEGTQLSIDGAGTNFFMAAWGKSNTFAYHGYTNKLHFHFDLKYCVNGQSYGSPGSQQFVSITTVPPHRALWKAHGLFASVAWAIFAPIAIGAAMLRRVFISSDLPALWLRIHMSVNFIVFIFTAFAFAFAVRAISLTANAHHFRDVKHRKTGLVLMLMLSAQTMSGLLRPPLPHPIPTNDEEDGDDKESEQALPKKSTKRVAFEIGHRVMGFILVFFAWWQVQNGLKLFAFYYSAKDFSGLFWGMTGVLSAIIFVLYVVHFKFC